MSDLKETALRLANTITKTSGELVKTTKLSFNLSSEKDKLKALYMEIGKKVHEIYIYGGSLGAAFDDKIKVLDAQVEKIKNLEAQINLVKGNKDCAKCGKTMERNAEFCPKCGQKSGETVSAAKTAPAEAPAPKVSVEPAPAPAVKVCSLCEKENTLDSKFCFHCGRVL